MSPELLILLMFAGLLIGVLLGHPVAFVLGGLGLTFGLIGLGPHIVGMYLLRVFGTMNNWVLVAIPLFIFMGVMLERSGVAETLYAAMHKVMGPLRGGLAIGTVLICTLMAAATGIVGASVVAMGLLALPAMLKRNYQKELATGSIMAGGTLGILIPPSIMLIVYGNESGLSVGKLYMGAIFPGLVLSALYVTYIGTRCLLQPAVGPALPPEERQGSLKSKLWLVLTSLLPPIFLIVSVLGSIFFGIATATEAAGVGAFGSILVAALYRRVGWRTLKETAYQTLRATSMVLIILVGATAFTGTFMALGGGKMVERALLALPLGPWGVLAAMLLIVFALGFFIDWIAILMLTIPVFTPLAAKLGLDALWFAILVNVTLQTSFLTPPFAGAIWYLQGVAPKEVTVGHLYRAVIPFVALQLVGLVVVMVFPQIALWLPGKMIK